MLRHLCEKSDTEATLMEKAKGSIMLQPNFFGVGINLYEVGALIARLFRSAR
jgi:hypothetical protein